MMRLRLFENFRYLIYAPFYAAHVTGAYEAEGLDVELLPSPGPGHAETALLEGGVEVMWAGPMRVMRHHDQNPNSPLRCFAEVVCRDPFSIVARRPNPEFRLADLATMRFASVSEVPTPWFCLQEDLRQAGVDPERLDRVADRAMAETLAALRAGEIEAAMLFEPVVEQAVGEGFHVWHQASRRGRTSYTAFITTTERLLRDRDTLLRMTRAIYRAERWIAAAAPAEIARAMGPYFPGLDRGVMERALARYAEQGIWGTDPVLPAEGFARLGRGMHSAGLISRLPDFAACVDNRLAEEAVRQLG
jgi:NitT/TauT family transport system substrate-binding protein